MFGTTHWSKGSARAKGAPPVIIWQVRPEVSLGMPGDEKVRDVPGATVPVLVTVSVWVALIPRSHPEMKGPAMAKICGGAIGMSNAEGIEVPSFKTFRIL